MPPRGGLELGGDGPRHHVGDDELAGGGGLGDAADVLRLGVIGREAADLLLQRGPPAIRSPCGLGHLAAFVDEAIHAAAPADKVLRRPRIARDGHAPAAALEAIADGRTDGIVVHGEGADRDPAHLEDLALLYLRHAHGGTGALDHVMPADLDVPVEVVEQLVHLPLRPRRAPHLEGRILPADPAGDEEMPQVDDVVRVMVRDEHARPVIGPHPRLDELGADTGACVDEEHLLAQRQQGGGAATLGIGRRRARAEKDGAHGAGILAGGSTVVKVGARDCPLTLPPPPKRGRGIDRDSSPSTERVGHRIPLPHRGRGQGEGAALTSERAQARAPGSWATGPWAQARGEAAAAAPARPCRRPR